VCNHPKGLFINYVMQKGTEELYLGDRIGHKGYNIKVLQRGGRRPKIFQNHTM
jgi:hypothetical protein